MMTRRIATLVLGTGLLGAFTWTSAFAQSEWLPKDATPVQKEFVDGLGTTLFDYWTPRLNDYKRTVDRLLSPTDLEKLNELRVRWSILMSDMSQAMKQQAEVKNEGEEENMDDIEMKIGEDGEVKFMELFTIWSETVTLAQGYRSGLDNLSTVVLDDAADFGDNVGTFIDDFADANRAALAADKEGAAILSDRSQVTQGIDKFKTTLRSKNADVMKVYGMAVEPIVLLFNGGDLRDMLPLTIGKTSGVDMQAVAGLLPEGAVLSQNVPNPASAATKINFTLTEPSSATTLRVYSSDGALMKSIDMGARPAGKGSQDLDVSGFANGSYLYHLTVTTQAGEMVYSKVMQVVR